MTDELPTQTPEGRMIEDAAKASGRSARQLAANAGISDTRWRQVVKGWQPGPGGEPIEVRAPALTLARMALALGIDERQLAEVGRQDAGDALVSFLNSRGEDSAVPMPSTIYGTVSIPSNGLVRAGGADEIDMIYASTMPAREKLLRIRQVLELRAQVEAEEARTRKKAPAAGAEAESSESQTS